MENVHLEISPGQLSKNYLHEAPSNGFMFRYIFKQINNSFDVSFTTLKVLYLLR